LQIPGPFSASLRLPRSPEVVSFATKYGVKLMVDGYG
jgi:hypothetical protein